MSSATHQMSMTIQQEFLQEIDAHKALVYKICRVYCREQQDHEDLFQEIIIQCWKAYPQFRRESKFSTWLYRIALNTAIAGLRKKKVSTAAYEPEKIEHSLAEESYEQEKEEQLKKLYSSLQQLSEVERALVMLYLEEKSYEEMEEILGISSGALRTKMSRVKDKLKKIMTQET
jgi:RNA polymerase sigma-70 factor, ECF subfamily